MKKVVRKKSKLPVIIFISIILIIILVVLYFIFFSNKDNPIRQGISNVFTNKQSDTSNSNGLNDKDIGTAGNDGSVLAGGGSSSGGGTSGASGTPTKNSEDEKVCNMIQISYSVLIPNKVETCLNYDTYDLNKCNEKRIDCSVKV
ncbi:hypothetical protein COU57_06300 [Candidatus Pacearchaeota archaeon CG10_big_fil_rev_8_21_14_0_10_32_14]|nr:MAG: hypothetical protein COU57_06300 [Candidatus Pacearchaeota archaeon CG10_big_fil_rev_8_21_14_0_10_32_14]